MRARHALWITLLLSTAALGQDPESVPRTMYLNAFTLQGSHRMVALGGAYAAIAEGVEGYSSNLTALAHRSPQNKLNIDVGLTFGLLDFSALTGARHDYDNDEKSDEAVSVQFQAGLLLQYKGAGIGGLWRSRGLFFGGDGRPDVTMSLNTYSGGFAFSLAKDNLLLGAGFVGASSVLFHGGQTNAYGGLGLQFDALMRPQFIPIRIGLSIKPQLTAGFVGDKDNPPLVAGRGYVSEIVIPATYSLGVSFKVGEGAEHYNRLSKNYLADLRRELGPENTPKEIADDALTGRVLVSLQLDVISSTKAAVPTTFYGSFDPNVPVVGGNTMYQPRAGVEVEAIRHRLRIRGGSYLEPSPFQDKSTRLHGTGGFELLMFHLVTDWALTGSIDYARQYSNFGLSIGFWR